MLSDASLAYAEELTTALLGVDALYRAESDDQDGLVVLKAIWRRNAPLGKRAVENSRKMVPLFQSRLGRRQLGHWIISALRPRVAARDPLGAQPATSENAVLLDGFVGIG